jgi:amino acid adenylation domain-containing protein
VYAWDGNLTYRELDELSTRVACRLVDEAVEPDTLVPLLFEKSQWAPISILGAMKAGVSFLLLDPALPVGRLQFIIEQVEAKAIVSSHANHKLASDLCPKVIIAGPGLPAGRRAKPIKVPGPSSLDSVNYMIFTSGTTGIPKGVTITHRNSASAIKNQVDTFRYTAESRVYDFSTNSFDGSLLNMFTTLVAGGCLCVPSEQDRRNNLGESINSLRANAVFLTPSVAELLSPEQVPCLKTLILGGEAVRVKDIQRWWKATRVFTIYGPSECTPISISNPSPVTPEQATRLGRGCGVATWIVDPQDHTSLLPPGAAGELLLEGPIVGPGYLNEPEKTAAAFIENPKWLSRGTSGQPGRTGRLYKTGDLVRYHEDGSLSFVGRKDTQVKIRGQRVELGEVEYRIQEMWPNASQVVAEVVVPKGQEATTAMLVVFIQIKNETTTAERHNDAVRILPMPADIEESMSVQLPSYMIPTVVFATRELPMSSTGKMDRKLLREVAGSYTVQQLAEAQQTNGGPKRQPKSTVEKQMQTIWSEVLGVAPDAIGLDDSFIRLGGDSIAAMKVVAEARKFGIELGVGDVFSHPRLHSMAKIGSQANGITAGNIPRSTESGPVIQSFAQERLWFLDNLYPGLPWYHMPFAIKLQGRLRLDALNNALLALQRRHETLRTTFTSEGGVNLQTVLPFHSVSGRRPTFPGRSAACPVS